MNLSALTRQQLEYIVASCLAESTQAVPGNQGSQAALQDSGIAGEPLLSGLDGTSSQTIGNYISVAGASNALHNGIFKILGVNSPTEVRLSLPNSSPPDANNGSIFWSEQTSTSETASIEPLVSSLLELKSELSACMAERDALQTLVDQYVAISTPGDASAPVGPSLTTVTEIGSLVMGMQIWSGLAFRIQNFAVGTAGYDLVDPKNPIPPTGATLELTSEVWRDQVEGFEYPSPGVLAARCRIPNDTLSLGIGELGIYGEIIREPDFPIPSYIPQTVGEEFLLSITHFPMQCINDTQINLYRVVFNL